MGVAGARAGALTGQGNAAAETAGQVGKANQQGWSDAASLVSHGVAGIAGAAAGDKPGGYVTTDYSSPITHSSGSVGDVVPESERWWNR